ncbi:MAG: NUDIX domain-containing protein [Mariniphaga sp.]|nr:NUDIX domain-containing protein [Mariniphaga sp.]
MKFNQNNFLKHISLDCAVFGFHDNQLKVLLLQTKHTREWALPGGFVKLEESVEKAANRVLKERTGVDKIFLHQFHVFSEPKRSEINPIVNDMKELDESGGLEWFNNRFISIGFYALVDFSKVTPTPDQNSFKCEWKSFGEIDSLILDHSQILNKALETIRLQLKYQPIGYNLLPDKFTMPELQKLYETILGRELDRRNFQRKILSYKILDKLEKRKTGGAYKSPYLYKFNIEKYNKALEDGLSGGW